MPAAARISRAAASSARSRRLPVAGHRRPHLAQRLTRGALNVGDLRRRERGCGRQQPPGQLALEHDHRQAVPEQVVQVASEAQPLLGHRQAGQVLARGAQLAERDSELADGDRAGAEGDLEE
jgi:hypothetical protein